MLLIDPHPLLDLHAFVTDWDPPLGDHPRCDWLHQLVVQDSVSLGFSAPNDVHKAAVRDLLRHGGFKPSGRGKPCWEYMRSMTDKGRFPEINVAVDATNLAALHGALPVSTVDAERLKGSLRVGIADPGSSYVFNASGQEIDLSGLLCLLDEEGPCANAVKDAQRTKTHEGTRRTLSVVWSTQELPERGRRVADWQMELHERLGGRCERV